MRADRYAKLAASLGVAPEDHAAMAAHGLQRVHPSFRILALAERGDKAWLTEEVQVGRAWVVAMLTVVWVSYWVSPFQKMFHIHSLAELTAAEEEEILQVWNVGAMVKPGR